jgi:glutamate synthase (NADPH) small chain
LQGRPLRDGVPDREHQGLLDGDKNGSFIPPKARTSSSSAAATPGTDCVGTAMRHGCKSLVQIEILPKPPLERAADNPWPEWPKVYKLDYGQEEAAAKFGADPRVYLTTAKKFTGDASGRVKEVHTVQIKWEAQRARASSCPRRSARHGKVRPAQLVLLAMGFLGPEQPLLKELGVERDARSNVKAEFTRNTRPTSPACLPPATAAAGRAWWCGRSTKAAAPPASATAT